MYYQLGEIYLNIGIVGMGWIAKNVHVPILYGNSHVKKIYFYDPYFHDENYISQYKLYKHSSYEDMLNESNISLIIICTPNHLHFEQIVKGLESKKYVFCEKPLCIKKNEIERLQELVLKYPNRLLIGLPNRFRNDMHSLKEFIDKEIGQVYKINCKWLRNNGIPGSQWFMNKSTSGGGVLIDLGAHIIDLAYWLLNYPDTNSYSVYRDCLFLNDNSKVASWHNNNINKINDSYNIEDTFSCFINAGDNISISIDLCWASFLQYDTTEFEVFGTTGYAKLSSLFGFSQNTQRDSSSIILNSYKENKVLEFSLKDRKKPFVSMWDHNISTIINNKEVSIDPKMVLKNLLLIETLNNS